MKQLPTQARALKKRLALIDAAISEFERHGFEIATAKSIAAKAKVATGTFYQYFENKNDILRVIALDRFKVLHQRIQLFDLKEVTQQNDSRNKGSAQLLNENLDQYFFSTLIFLFEFHSAEPELHKVLEQRRDIDLQLKSILDEGENVLLERVKLFVRSYNINHADLVAENLFAMAEGLVHRLAFQHTEKSQQELQEALALGSQMLASYFDSNTPNIK